MLKTQKKITHKILGEMPPVLFTNAYGGWYWQKFETITEQEFESMRKGTSMGSFAIEVKEKPIEEYMPFNPEHYDEVLDLKHMSRPDKIDIDFTRGEKYTITVPAVMFDYLISPEQLPLITIKNRSHVVGAPLLIEMNSKPYAILMPKKY